MSDHKPSKPYVYQPHGTDYEPPDRLWGVAGIHTSTEITGLTRAEAKTIVLALTPGKTVVPDNDWAMMAVITEWPKEKKLQFYSMVRSMFMAAR